MPILMICHDHPNALDLRLANRDAHLDYARETDMLERGGPLLDADGQMCGSFAILKTEDLEEARAWSAADPYVTAGLFARTEFLRWKSVIGG